jgi:hypothetical protein
MGFINDVGNLRIFQKSTCYPDTVSTSLTGFIGEGSIYPFPLTPFK